LKEYRRALEAFRQGFRRYPDDPRFHPTRVRSDFRAGDIEQAKQEIGQALAVNPDDAFAAELLADLEISEGNTAVGLRILNERNQPRLLRIGPNYSLSFSDWIVPRSVVFHPGDVLTVGRWQTTQARLWASNAFSHVALELEPLSIEDQYNAIIRASPRLNTWSGVFVELAKNVPFKTISTNLGNVGVMGIQWASMYRWDQNRRRFETSVSGPFRSRVFRLLRSPTRGDPKDGIFHRMFANCLYLKVDFNTHPTPSESTLNKFPIIASRSAAALSI